MHRLFWLLAAITISTTTALAGKAYLPLFQVHNSVHGNILANAGGMTLYTFDGDSRYRPKCEFDCSINWRPFVVKDGYHGMGYWTPIIRADRVVQWAYGGKPLYTFSGDRVPGDMNGERHGNGRWHAARVLCMSTNAEGWLRDGPVIQVVDTAQETGIAPLLALRRWCGVDLGDLAERSGVEIDVIAAHEDGRRGMNLRERAAVANALGVPVYLLLD